MTKVIPRNNNIPTKKSQIFSTAADNQPVVTLKIYEGERSMTKDNHLLGQFDLTGIPPAPRGVPQVEVTFELDANGLLIVSAEEKGSGTKNQITVTNDQNRFTPEDIEKMIADAEKFAEADKAIKERVDLKNDLEGMAYSVRSQIEDEDKIGSKLSEDDKERIRNAVDEAVEFLDSNPEAELEDLRTQKSTLEGVVHPIMAKVYESAGADDTSHDSG
ncbi:hypothetical protein SARC_17968, partial [Sphaeroforma arctica JP610]